MTTTHTIIIGPAQNMQGLADATIDLVVTSPPYPMIEMWDEILANQNEQIRKALELQNGDAAFEQMHAELDQVWKEVDRVLKPGGIACINIGDATRTMKGKFALYPNHARIISTFLSLGLTNLPNIIWRKQTNAPNKFMGSGMLPAGAYVTLEHEWILVFRKGEKRIFTSENEKQRRKQSAFFWEERNIWFSDLWDLKGTKQVVKNPATRERSAAFPFEIPYRLINMYSVKGDTVLDPFLGTGTTTIAALASERNSIGIEIDKAFASLISSSMENIEIDQINDYLQTRLLNHQKFIQSRAADLKKDPIKHFNHNLRLPVITSQEKEISISLVESIIKKNELFFKANYYPFEAVPVVTKDFLNKTDPKKEQRFSTRPCR